MKKITLTLDDVMAFTGTSTYWHWLPAEYTREGQLIAVFQNGWTAVFRNVRPEVAEAIRAADVRITKPIARVLVDWQVDTGGDLNDFFLDILEG
jgi:hypothetical protein